MHDLIEREQYQGKGELVTPDPQWQDTKKLAKQLQLLEKEMRRLAQNMEFEQAAKVRDQWLALKQHYIE